MVNQWAGVDGQAAVRRRQECCRLREHQEKRDARGGSLTDQQQMQQPMVLWQSQTPHHLRIPNDLSIPQPTHAAPQQLPEALRHMLLVARQVEGICSLRWLKRAM